MNVVVSTCFHLLSVSTLGSAVGLNVCALFNFWRLVALNNILAPYNGMLAEFSQLMAIHPQLLSHGVSSA